MSKLYLYCMIVIFVYVLVIYPLNKQKKESSTHEASSGTIHGGNGGTFDLKSDGVENGAKGQLRYRFGYTK